MASINERNLKLGDKSKFQLVLVGYDRKEKGHKDYIKNSKLNFPAIKFDDKKKLEKLVKTGETGFLPSLVMLKSDGTMVSNDRKEVMKKLEGMAPETP